LTYRNGKNTVNFRLLCEGNRDCQADLQTQSRLIYNSIKKDPKIENCLKKIIVEGKTIDECMVDYRDDPDIEEEYRKEKRYATASVVRKGLDKAAGRPYDAHPSNPIARHIAEYAGLR